MQEDNYWQVRMQEDGFIPRTDAQVTLYKLLGTKDYKKLSQVGFNMAYAERCLKYDPKHGSYQADMMHGQALAERILFETLNRDGYNKDYVKGFLEEFTEDALFEELRQRTAYARLEETCRDDAFFCDLEGAE